MSYENIAIDYIDHVAILKLNAPEVLNALSPDMVQELSSAITDIIQSDARCLLITGEGRAFCAGASERQRLGDAPTLDVGCITFPLPSGKKCRAHRCIWFRS